MNPRLGIALGLFACSAVALANTYTVTSVADSGAGTLRMAITDANANPGADTIAFNIVGSGVHTIVPAATLPAITGPATIDGYTQPGSSANTNPTSQGLNTVLRIEIDGSGLGFEPCLDVQADDVTIKGLVINRCAGSAIETTNAHQDLVVEGCFIGTNPAGTQSLEPLGIGISLRSHTNARIGGTTAAARNLVSGNSNSGYQLKVGSVIEPSTGTLVAGNLLGTDVTGTIRFADNATAVSLGGGSNNTVGGTSAGARNVMVNEVFIASTGNLVQGNHIGTDVSGTISLGCYGWCIYVGIGASDNTIGGSAAGAGNVIGGDFTTNGIDVLGSGTIIQGNFIGTDPTGTSRLGHGQNAIYVRSQATDSVIGGTAPGEGNLIAYNSGHAAVAVWGATGVTIRGNEIFDNNGLGIDLMPAFDSYGVTYNDIGDGDGANNFQNYPILTSITYGGASTTVAGVLDSTASTVFDVDFYAGAECAGRPLELPEARTYLGTAQVTTDGSGHGSFNEVLPVAVAANTPITATATDPAGNTSELSPRFVISATPRSGSLSGQFVTVFGLAFVDGATVTVGGLPATNVDVQSANQLTMTTPALAAGSINDIVVSNPGGGESGTLPGAYIPNFNDVDSGNQFYQHVTALVANGITAGTGGGNYGVSQSTLRQQMAVFLLKAKYGVCYTPPPCQSQFPDVACPSTFANWIEALADEGITGGCGGGLYCPTNPVTRQQMSVFLLKALHGSGYLPPPCAGQFTDVACPSQFANWIEQLAAENITGGCGGSNYCPLNNVTRGQMAAFLVNTFNLP